jgi:tetratricopeptide (TPR) repeat protein
VARVLRRQGSAAQAEKYLAEAHHSALLELGDCDGATLKAAETWASCLSDQGSHAAALTLWLEVLRGCRSVGAADSQVVSVLGSIAAEHRALGQFQVRAAFQVMLHMRVSHPLQEALAAFEAAASLSRKVNGVKHLRTVVFLRQGTAVCIDAQLYSRALELLAVVFECAENVQVCDYVSCMAANFYLGNHDVVLELADEALLHHARVGDGGEPRALLELHCYRVSVMSLQNRLHEAKEALEHCSCSGNLSHATPLIFWSACCELAAATARCGDVSASRRLFAATLARAAEAHGTHGTPTLLTQHSYARFLWEFCEEECAQRDAEALIIRTVEAKKLLLGANHNSTLLSMQLMCQVLGRPHAHPLHESAVLQLLSSSSLAAGWMHVDTIDALLQLAILYEKSFDYQRAELLYSVVLCLLNQNSGEQADFLKTRTQNAVLQLYKNTSQTENFAIFLAAMRHSEGLPHEHSNMPFITRNFSVELLEQAQLPDVALRLLRSRVCDLKHVVSGSHPARPLVRLSEAILCGATGESDRARALFSSCLSDMGDCWWNHPDSFFIVASLSGIMIAQLDFESSSALLNHVCDRWGERTPQTAASMMLLAANALRNVNNTELAVQFLQNAIALQSLRWGAASSGALSSRRLLAGIHVASGALRMAEDVMWDALESCEACLGPSHAASIEWLEELSKLYSMMNLLPKASFMAEIALRSCLKTFGQFHMRTLDATEHHAQLLRSTGKLRQARDVFEHCLQMRVCVEGQEASSTQLTRSALFEVQQLLMPQLRQEAQSAAAQRMRDLEACAAQLLQADDFEGASHTLSTCFRIAEDAFGSDSLPAASAALSYGCLLLQSEQFETSQALLQQALVTLQQSLDSKCGAVLVALAALARAHVGLGDLKAAEGVFLDCLDRCERSLGFGHRFSAVITLQLGQLYCMIEDMWHTARELLQDSFAHACTILHQRDEHYSPQFMEYYVSESLESLLSVLLKLEDLESAEVVLQKAVDSKVRLYGATHSSTVEAASQLGQLYLLNGKPELSSQLLEHVLMVRVSKLGCSTLSTFFAAENLARAYVAASQCDLAELLLSLCATQWRRQSEFLPREFRSGQMLLALLLQQRGKFEAAFRCYLEFLEGEASSAVVCGSAAVTAAENASVCMWNMGLSHGSSIMFEDCLRALKASSSVLEGADRQRKNFYLRNLGLATAFE